MSFPTIRIDFWVSGDNFDPEVITKTIGIVPTKTRLKEEAPRPETAQTSWRLSIEQETCRGTCIQFDKMLELLRGKELQINDVCKKFNLETTFSAAIDIEKEDNPELVLTREFITFASSINADIGFNVYLYTE